jgi:membrane-associated phospholipid phosphatase
LRGSDFDTRLMQAAGRLRRPWLNAVVVPYTRAGNNGIGWVVVALLAADPIRAGVTVWGTLAVNSVIKVGVRRRRPLAQEVKALVNLPVTTSFPSAHASTSMAGAFALSHGQPEWAPLWFLLAALMGASRVYVGAHHASDVIAGFVLGGLIGAGASAVDPPV